MISLTVCHHENLKILKKYQYRICQRYNILYLSLYSTQLTKGKGLKILKILLPLFMDAPLGHF